MSKIIAYLQGWSRYYLFYSREIFGIDLSCLIRKHIREQIETRIDSMHPICYNQGQCKKCGCATTALQMANKPCEGNCYPKMLGPKNWKFIKQGKVSIIDNRLWTVRRNLFKLIELGPKRK